MPQLDVSQLRCPMALLEVKRWLHQQVKATQCSLLITGEQECRDILRYLHMAGFTLLAQYWRGSQLQLTLTV
ncbi:sulfurtransferase TusA family protein [Neptunicella marina]|uniref:Sulfurtransferase TusA family protein n=1 Tax=Neptunicella marina TaxID=2125989 RepID=A0A8J6IYB1_9ALTE|nr:sulfurtransferase TusA family protein [Neptunicella marina]MBC3767353.1 sulfurtransferase TusA family protein [Neptunicella marina]